MEQSLKQLKEYLDGIPDGTPLLVTYTDGEDSKRISQEIGHKESNTDNTLYLYRIRNSKKPSSVEGVIPLVDISKVEVLRRSRSNGYQII